MRLLSAELSALFLFDSAESIASLLAFWSFFTTESWARASCSSASAFAFSIFATWYAFCAPSIAARCCSTGTRAMYMSSKCLDSGPGAESEEPPQAAVADSSVIAMSFERERIGGVEPTTAALGELPSGRDDCAARRRCGEHQHRGRGVPR